MDNIWCIKAGKDGEADNLFLNEKVVALSWPQMGNLQEIAKDKTAMKEKMNEEYPDIKQGAIPGYIGMLSRFVNDIKIGDIAVYPSKIDKQIHIGKITSDYKFDPQKNPEFPHQRSIKWEKHFPRSSFSQSALFEIGSLLSLTQVKTAYSEFENAIKEKNLNIGRVIENDVTEKVDYEQTARDFIVKRILRDFKGHPFTHLFAALLETMGYRTKVSPPGPDHGVDIIASKDELGCVPPLLKIQCKGIEGKIKEDDIGYFMSVVEENEIGIFVNLGEYSKPAKDKAFHSSKIRLLDQDDVIDLVLEHYESLSPEWKIKIPLKKVYVPDPQGEEL